MPLAHAKAATNPCVLANTYAKAEYQLRKYSLLQWQGYRHVMARPKPYLFANVIAILLAHARTASKPHMPTNTMGMLLA